MTKKLPLEVRIETFDSGKIVEFSAGKTKDTLEKVGRMNIYQLENFKVPGYMAYETEQINSFHTTEDALGNRTTTKIKPKEEIMLKTGDRISWGYDRPLVGFKARNRRLN